MKFRLSRWAMVLLAMTAGAARADDVPTVGSVTKNNGLTENGRFIVKTPNILRIEPSQAVKPDPRQAIAHYDRIIALRDADPAMRAEAMRRAAYLRVKLADDGEGGTTSSADVAQAIAIYRQLLREYPDDPANDLAIYQLARAEQLAGDNDAAIVALRDLGQRYGRSPLVADARFRAAELLYLRQRYDEAEPLYAAVVAQGADTPYFAPARAKYGWTLYQEGKYETALPVLLSILDSDLPPGTLEDPKIALAAAEKRKGDFAGDALSLAGRSFAALGGGVAINRYLAQHGEPRFATLLYAALGGTLLEQRRYVDAAQVYAAFIERHPQHRLAPDFQQRAIAAYEAGGFNEPMMAARETYVQRYSPGTSYWQAQGANAAPPEAVLTALRGDLDDLARWHRARAQDMPADDGDARRKEFLVAADWYRRRLELEPAGVAFTDGAAEIAMHYADSLYDGGRTRDAAQRYEAIAYDSGNRHGAEAAYAALQAWQRLAGEVPPAQRAAALAPAIASAQRFADRYPDHPQWTAALTRSAQDLYETGKEAAAIGVAQRALDAGRATPAQRTELLTVIADSQFSAKDYAKAEAAYLALLQSGVAPEQRGARVERLATAIYRQGEAARDAGDPRAAAAAFQRVGQLAPDASIRATADYDAATALMTLKDWRAAEMALESFRSRYPQHALLADVDKKLAFAYEQDGQLAAAAAAYRRIAARDGEAPELRRDAAWQAALLYDKARLAAPAAQAYEASLDGFAQPLDRELQARRRLADLARDELHDDATYRRWLQTLVAVDAGGRRTPQSALMAAQANLELGRLDAEAARRIALDAPIARSLPRRKQAAETAIATLLRAANSNDADITTAASDEIGNVYRDFGAALLHSERPRNLSGDALEQYQILLEEQADPFEQKSIEAYEANLGRVRQGLWNDAIRRSAASLAELAPARYGKHEMREDRYDALQ
ncbi:tetratricopeptide repeat protein [Solimonas soli]|uniref:tetratricopeptide repeat protein n=1 Tax=Solimonas soli TaxID=413479 RepID=UPI0004B51155|nr:tetratricopeptide repeat protein [Solimonas soli]